MLFTDIVGSPELHARLGDEAVDGIRRQHFDLLSTAVRRAGGREGKRPGDSVMAIFGSAVDAVSCAIAIQRAAASAGVSLEASLAVRSGIDAGEVTEDDGDYHGSAVNDAALLCQAATGGQILASDLVRSLVGNRGGHRFRHRAARSLKGLSKRVAGWEVSWREEAGSEEASALSGLSAHAVTLLWASVTRTVKDGIEPPNLTELLGESRPALKAAIAGKGGVDLEIQGDAFLVAFAEGSGALAAATEIQTLLARGPLSVSIGLHTGNPLPTSHGYVGVDVRLAASIADAGHGGQVVLSEATRDLVDTATKDLGRYHLRYMTEPVHLYQVGLEDFPPLRGVRTTNLPPSPNIFMGRALELTAVLALLSQPHARLVTLTGTGGTGKTRLAQQAAAELEDQFPHGVYWVSLGPIHDPDMVRGAISESLGAKDDLTKHIHDRRLLLVLDNFEHLLDAVPLVADLLAACPNIQILATSRERLHLQVEHEYPVPPLAEEEAVQFFLARARSLVPGITESSAITEVCRRLDQLPLALELAAARMKTLSQSQLLARLERRLPLLSGGPRDAPERQRTLRATIDWSFELLTEGDRRLFRRLSVFVGGWTLDAAEGVADAELDSLQSLVEKNLVGHAHERFTMLETIGEFAQERLTESGEQDELRRRHAKYFARLGTHLGPRVRASELEAVALMDADYRNARMALDWALACGEHELSERLLRGLRFYWITQGLAVEGYRTGLAVLERALSPSPRLISEVSELARVNGDLDRAIELKERVIRTLDGTDEPSALPATETIATGISDRELPASQELTERGFLLPNVLADLALTLVQRGDIDRAQRLAERGLAIRMARGNAFGIAHAQEPLIRIELHRGNYAKAATLAEDSIRVWQAAKAWSDLALGCVLAAIASRGAGDTALTRMQVRRALQAALACRQSSALTAALEQAAVLAAEKGKYEVALRLYSSASAWRQASGDAFDRDDTAWRLSAESMPEGQRAAHIKEGGELSLADATAYALDYLEQDNLADQREAAVPPQAPAADALPEKGQEGYFQLEGEYWSIRYAGQMLRLRDSKGLRIVACLLAEPGRPFPALDLERLGQAGDAATVHALASQDAGELLDEQARSAYRARLAELRDEVDEATSSGDAVRFGTLNDEMHFITRELARGLGLGGRSRRGGSIAERARLNVTRATRASIQRIAAVDPRLAAHLNVALHTGAVCLYAPDPRSSIAWRVSPSTATRPWRSPAFGSY